MQEECKAPIIMLILRGFILYNQRQTSGEYLIGTEVGSGNEPDSSVRITEEIKELDVSSGN